VGKVQNVGSGLTEITEVGLVLISVIAISQVGFFVIAASNFAWAAASMANIENWRNAVTDVVNITVLEFDKKTSTKARPNGSITRSEYSLTARVDVVDRTANGLKPLSTIIVQYDTNLPNPLAPV
jgi:hypothetical protein